ncbi:hypothetical protein [Flavobacterium sp.]|uniref:hypothetical protein n=1 Tax=Flavobacterium sp. TaxID=239 RepID=UPI0028BD275A|nr:hypothetical protein [Flavobacterium sp.]
MKELSFDSSIVNLRKELLSTNKISQSVLDTIHQEQWLNIWVPIQYGGLGLSFDAGLSILKNVAKINGSLGWLVTLCSGANYFSRNLQPETASAIFKGKAVCFGGSGTVGGTAEISENGYIINGFWPYATGAPYLTHFTLNAHLTSNGKQLLDENDEPIIKSFVLNANQVVLEPCWKAMGMVATASHSFKVSRQLVSEEYSFVYNHFYTDAVLDQIPFEVFAVLPCW